MTEGHCLCGAIGWRYSGAPTWACYCHCDDCRRNCSAPVTAFIGVPLDQFEWMGEPKFYPSSPGVKRYFCDGCGTPMAFEAEHYPGEIHVYAASLKDPHAFKPEFHVHTGRQLPWLVIDDHLPRHQKSAPETSDE